MTAPATQVPHLGMARTQVVHVPVFALTNVPAVEQTHTPFTLVKPVPQVLQLEAVPLQEVHPGMQAKHSVKPPQLPLLATVKKPLLQVAHVAE